MPPSPPAPQRAVIFAAHPWAGIPYGLHHIARTLAAIGWRVLYVEPPFSALHLAAGRARGRRIGRCPRPSGVERLELLSPFAFLPHLPAPGLRSAGVLRFSFGSMWPNPAAAAINAGFDRPDLVISGLPAAFGWVDQLTPRVRAYRLADDLSLFRSVTPAMRALEAETMARYDVVLATSPPLQTAAAAKGARRTLLLSNGVDIEHFARPRPIPADIASLSEPRVVYAGALEQWFDWPLVAAAAAARPDVTFMLVGRVGAPAPPALPTNVRLFGSRRYDEIPAYLQAAQFGIIPFRHEGLPAAVAAINPLKLYEYLAAGVPVVSSVGPAGLIGVTRYETADGFLTALAAALAGGVRGAALAPRAFDWRAIVESTLKDIGLAG